jgi:hypothetical protein
LRLPPDRWPQILYERHIFHRRTGGKFAAKGAPEVSQHTAGGYGALGAHQYARLQAALKLDRRAALESCSWGLGQVMGFNARDAGYASAEAMVEAMCESEDAQFQAMINFIVANRLAGSLQAADWAGVANAYNGPDFQKNRYDEKLRLADARFTVGPLPSLRVRSAQLYLSYLGYAPGGVDGWYGANTQKACRFQRTATAGHGGIDDAPALQQAALSAGESAARCCGGWLYIRRMEPAPPRKIRYAKPLAIALAAFVLYALLGFFAGPPLVKRAIGNFAAQTLQRKASIGEARLNPLLFSLELKDFALTEADGAPIVGFKRLFADFELSSLLRFAWTFSAVELDGLDLRADIAPDGRFNLLALLDSCRKRIRSRRAAALLHRVALAAALTFSDRSLAEPAQTKFAPIDLEVLEISTLPERSGSYTVNARFADGGALAWRGNASLQPLASQGDIAVTGAKLATAWRFLRDRYGLAEPRGEIDAAARYRFVYAAGAAQLAAEDIKVRGRGIALFPSGGRELSVATLEAGGRAELNAAPGQPWRAALGGIAVNIAGVSAGQAGAAQPAGTLATIALDGAHAGPGRAPAGHRARHSERRRTARAARKGRQPAAAAALRPVGRGPVRRQIGAVQEAKAEGRPWRITLEELAVEGTQIAYSTFLRRAARLQTCATCASRCTAMRATPRRRSNSMPRCAWSRAARWMRTAKPAVGRAGGPARETGAHQSQAAAACACRPPARHARFRRTVRRPEGRIPPARRQARAAPGRHHARGQFPRQRGRQRRAHARLEIARRPRPLPRPRTRPVEGRGSDAGRPGRQDRRLQRPQHQPREGGDPAGRGRCGEHREGHLRRHQAAVPHDHRPRAPAERHR